MPLLFAVLLGFVISWGSLGYVTDVTLKTRSGEVSATNFLMYQNLVSAYDVKNAPADGVVADTAISAAYPPGYVRNTAFTNVISGQVLYTYAPPASVTPGFLAYLTKTNRYSVAKVISSGTAQTIAGNKTVPTAIPVGSVVIIGN